MLVDSHCHLNFPDFQDDLDAVIARACEAGITHMQTICTDMEEFDEVLAIASVHPQISCSVGVHPNESGVKARANLDFLLRKAEHPKVIGIGETGLDYHYDTSDRKTQQESFRVHIAAARESGVPVIVHTRDAEEDTLRILEEEKAKGDFTGVIHCFTASSAFAQKALAMGFYLSFSGILTFKNAQSIRDVAKDAPADRILVETDAPFLAPLPYRGKRCEPAYVQNTNRLLAELRNVPEEICAQVTTDNFFRLFSKARRS